MKTISINQENVMPLSQSLKEKEYWKNTLSGEIEKIFFPHDLNGNSDEMAYHDFEIKDESFNRILSLSKESIPMIYMILVANLKTLLFKYLGENDIIIGSPVEKQKDNKNLINTILPLRSKISNNISYKELLLQVRKTIIDAIDNQNYPFETIKNDLKSGHSFNSVNPLFDIAVHFENLHDKKYLESSGASVIFSFEKCDDKIEARIEYKSSLYKEETIIKIGELYAHLMKQVLFNIEKPYSEILLVSDDEYNSLIFDWNKTTKKYPFKTSIVDIFEEQAKKCQEEIALYENGNTITYKALDERANQFANSLKIRRIEKGAVVGVLLDRSIDFIISVLGILKAECIFLSIDIASHDERIKYILEDSGCKLLITNKEISKNLKYEGDQMIFDLERIKSGEISAPIRKNNEGETAYIIYTSGTTGKPKGTNVLHKGLLNYILWASENYDKGEKLSFPLFTSVAFDLTITSIFTPLISGGALHIYNRNDNAILIEEILKDNNVNVVKLTPSHLKLIRNYKFDENKNVESSIKRFIVGGEQLETSIAREIHTNFLGKIEIFNEYGPTEATVGCMIYKFNESDNDIAVPIGKPIANTQIYLLNRFLEPVPKGLLGDIYISGFGLANGYHKKTELTAAKFIDNPFIPGEKMYKTGDLGRLNDSNNMKFIGRADQQVKIRGFRVELGEIENKIQTYLNNQFAETNILPSDFLQLNIEEQKRCTKCLLPENYEGATIGDDGVCSICNEFESYKEKAFDYFKTKDDLNTLIQNSRKKSQSKYDCLLLFSGGKDSTYVLHQLVKMGLKILTFTYDNGYISTQAFENIDKITKKYNVDSLIIESENMREVLCESLKSDHNVCNGCFKGVNTVGAKIANDYGINVVFTGLSRGQIFEIKLQGLYKLGIRDSDEIDQQLKIFRREYHSMNTKTSRLLDIKFEDEELDNIQFVDYFRYDDIKTRDVLDYLIKVDKSWDKPADTGTSSSNCMINDVGIYVHYKDKGYHFYADQSSWDCRLETISREEGIDELKGFNPNYKKIGEILNELGYYNNSNLAIVVDKADNKGDKALCAYFVADKKVDISDLQKSLAGQLPDYMMPSYFMQIDKIPLTLSGKVNKELLPEPKISIETKYVAPVTTTQKKLVEIWSDVLGINREEIGIQNNFFELGGHSLKATLLISDIEKRLNVKTPLVKIFENPTIEGLSLFLDNNTKSIYSSLKQVKPKEFYNVSSAQKRLFFVLQLNKTSTAYNKTSILKIEGNLNVEKLESVFNELIQRHESFRTTFHLEDGNAVQKIHESIEFNMKHVELHENDLDQFISNFIKPFNLGQTPLIRVALVKVSKNSYYLVVDMSHIITDGSSIKVFVDDLKYLYEGKTLPPLKLQYKEFSEWQNNLLLDGTIKKQEEFWMNKLSGEIPRVEIEPDFVRPKVFNFKGNSINHVFNNKETKEIYALAKDNEATLFMVFVSALNILLSKYTMQKDIIIGCSNMGRRHADLSTIVGMFINKLLIRNKIDSDLTYRDFLSEVRNNSLEALENQEVQFEFLVDKLVKDRDPSRTPLVGIDLVVQNFIQSELKVEGIAIKNMAVNAKTSRADITFFVFEHGDTIELLIEYYTEIFKEETMLRLVSHINNLIKSVLKNPEIKLKELDIITDEEKRRLLYEFNNTAADYPKDKTIYQLFEQQVARTPDNIAVSTKDKSINYSELHIMAERLAKVLRSNGVSSGNVVSLMLDRSIEMIIGLMGILRAGCCYLPIIPGMPKSRLNYVLEDSESPVILTQTKYIESLDTTVKSINLEELESLTCSGENLPEENNPNNLAYIIYTSGTTGNPKGVMIENHSVLNRIKWMQKNYPITSEDIILQKTPYTFDVSVWELFWWCFEGASVYMLEPEGEKDPLLISRIIEEKKINVMHFVPSMLEVFLNVMEFNSRNSNLGSLKYVFSSGEALRPNQVRSFYQLFTDKVKTKLVNLYGPTEATVDVSYFDCLRDVDYKNIPIGKPIDNTELYILDKDSLQLQAVGIIGELMISGVGLSRGYLKKDELTKEKFIDHPYKEGEKLYRTGDLARWLPDGNIEFLGRIDHQVKIRGNRIELGEIENSLLEYESIKETVVLAIEDNNEKYLCAYVVCKEELNHEKLRDYMSTQLPDYMVPSYFVELESLPLNANGKVNRKVLPLPEVKAGDDYVAPSNELEEKLVKIWSEVLNVPQEEISTTVSFFAIGGQSLKATLMVNEIYKQLKVELPLANVFEYNDIRALVRVVSKLVKSEYYNIEKAPEKDYYKLSVAQKRLYVLYEFNKDSTAYNMSQILNLGIEPDLEKIKSVLEQLIMRHEILRTSFKVIDNEVMQKISKQIDFEIEYYQSSQKELKNVVQNFIRPFDLSKSPLIRVGLVKTDNRENILLIDMHHIITDGLSQNLLIKDFKSLYNNEVLDELKLQYTDYSEWQHSIKGKEKIKKQSEYWIKEFETGVPSLNIITDYERPEVQSFEGANLSFLINQDQSKQIKEFCQRVGVTEFMYFISVYTLLWNKLLNKEKEILFGVGLSGRIHPDIQNVIGFFVNTLPFCIDISPDISFEEFIEDVKNKSFQLLNNQGCQFEDLIMHGVIEKRNAKLPLYEAAFVWQNTDNLIINEDLVANSGELESYGNTAKFDVLFSGQDNGGSYRLNFNYSTKLFKESTIIGLKDIFCKIIDNVTSNENILISKLDIIREDIKSKLNEMEEDNTMEDIDFTF